MLVSRTLAATSAPTRAAAFSNEMFSSCPDCAFVEGVKMTSGSLSDSKRPLGNLMSHTVPDLWYSFQPEPER
jgi:hypothetical protein